MARRGDGVYQRGHTWWLDFTHQDERHYVRIGRNISKTAAREIASVKRAAILKGEAGIGRKRRDLPFDQAKEAFVAWARTNLKPRTAVSYAECLTRLSESALFAGKRLGQITAWAVERYKQERAKKARVRVNRELAVLKAVFNRMRDWKKYEGENPVAGVEFLKEPRTRLRYLEPEEEKALLDAATENRSKALRYVILVGIHAGLRIPSEALSLRWIDVDLRRGVLTVPASYAKNGCTRSVPMNSVLRAAFAELKKATTDELVFIGAGGKPLKGIRNAFEAACAAANLKDVTPHTLRHTFASRLAMAGVDLRTIQELGGWKTLALVERYAHLSPSHKAEAVERIAKDFPTVFTTPDPCGEQLKSVSV